MGIKKVNKEDLLNKKVSSIKPVIVEEEFDEEEFENYEEYEDEVIEEEVEIEPPVLKQKSVKNKNVKNTNQNKSKKEEPKKEEPKVTNNSGKKKLGGKPKKEKTERTIGTVYPKDLMMKELQSVLNETFEGISLNDCKVIFDAVEKVLYNDCQVATVRFLGGLLSSQERNALLAKAPKVDYYSYTEPRKVIVINNAELGQPEKYRGTVNEDKTVFTVNQRYDYKNNTWIDDEGEFDL